MHHQDVRQPRDQADRLEILHGVVGQLGIEERIDRVGRDRSDQEGVAVRRGLRDRAGAEIAARARAVLHDERLAEILLHVLREQPPEQVGGAAGRERHDEIDLLGRPFLRTARAPPAPPATANAPIECIACIRFLHCSRGLRAVGRRSIRARRHHVSRAGAANNPGGKRMTKPLSEAARAKLLTVSTATLTTQLFKRGLRNTFVQGARPLNPNGAADGRTRLHAALHSGARGPRHARRVRRPHPPAAQGRRGHSARQRAGDGLPRRRERRVGRQHPGRRA